MIRILVAEDSPTVALLLRQILEQETDFEVVGHARDGREAVDMAGRFKPDLVTMDVEMPGKNGIEATREIMSTNPVPIVIVSAHVDDHDAKVAFRALEEGAVAVLKTPAGYGKAAFDAVHREFIGTIRAMAEVKLVTRRRARAQPLAEPTPVPADAAPDEIRVVAIGCSTGGPAALRGILSGLSRDFPVPVVVVQHISDGFIGGLVDWLGESTALEVRIAAHEERLRPGVVYFGPDDRHLLIARGGTTLYAVLDDSPPFNGFCPSVDVLMGSVSRSCGAHAVGGVLTGMGADGAEGLLQVRQAGGATFVQDEASAVIYGMPEQAVALGAAQQIVPLDQIGDHLLRLTRNVSRPRN